MDIYISSHKCFEREQDLLFILGEVIIDVFLWSPNHGHASIGRLLKAYIQQMFVIIGCQLEDLPDAMDDREKRRENAVKIHVINTL